MSVSTPAAPQQGPSAAAGRAAQPVVPFAQASLPSREQPLTFTITPGTATITLGPSDLTPNGFLRYVEVHVKTTVAGAGGSPVGGNFYPFNFFENMQFIDTGGQRMDDIPGLAMYVDNYVDGYKWKTDPASAYDYANSVTSPNFRLRFTRELFPDGKGSLPNLSGSQKYRIRLIVDAGTNIWATPPTSNYPTVEIDIIDHLWLLPAPQDGGGRQQQRQPPLLGLAQYRTSWYPNVSISSQAINYQIKTTGNLIKYIAMIGYNNSGVPSDAVFPNPLTLRVDNNYPYSSVPLEEVIQEFWEQLPGTPTARPTGLVVLPFNTGLGRTAGDQGVSSWLATSTATYIALQGSQATLTTGSISFLVCEISTAEINPAERSSMNNGTGTWQPAIPQTVQGGV